MRAYRKGTDSASEASLQYGDFLNKFDELWGLRIDAQIVWTILGGPADVR